MPEQSKKWLWIALSASAFALVVIGAAFLFFAPVKSSSPVPFDIRGKAEPRKEEPGEYLANEPPGMVTTQTTSGDIIIVYGNEPTSTTLAPAQAPAPVTTTTLAKAAPVTTTVPKPVTTTVPKPVATPTTVKKALPPPSPAASGSSFWIQAGSFKARDSADTLKAAFAEKGMVASIVVKDIDGKSYYQVKVGPYASRDEAKKWLTTVRAVPGSSQEAFVTQ